MAKSLKKLAESNEEQMLFTDKGEVFEGEVVSVKIRREECYFFVPKKDEGRNPIRLKAKRGYQSSGICYTHGMIFLSHGALTYFEKLEEERLKEEFQ